MIGQSESWNTNDRELEQMAASSVAPTPVSC